VPQQQPYGYPQQPGQPAPYGQQPQYGAQPGGYPPPPPAQGGGGKKTGLIIGAVVVALAVIGGGGYLLLGGGGGLEDDGAHKLSTPATLLGDYQRVSKDGQELGGGSAVKDLEKSGVSEGKSVMGQYTTADVSNYDPNDPSSVPDIKTAKGITFVGAYGKIADPQKVLDTFFAQINKDSSSNGAKMVGSPEEVTPDGFNGLMKCQAATGPDPLNKKEKTDWFCVWADHSTLAMVSPGDATKGVDKDTAIKLTVDTRNAVRVKA
jgi:hypothetical protein